MNTVEPLHSTYDRHLDRHFGRRSFVASCGLGLTCAMVLSACSSPPKPTTVTLQFSADADANPDVRGRASPLTVRVYALKTAGSFDSADFFSLFDKDQATLGGELVRREELLLRPGESRTLNLTLPDDARVLAFVAAYRDLERARWRETSAVQANKAQTVDVRLTARKLQLTRKAP